MNIRKGTGSTVLLNISVNNIREGAGSNVLFNISGNNIRRGTGSTTVLNRELYRKVPKGLLPERPAIG